MAGPLVLSLFPGIDGFGMGFEAEGYSVVAGPDVQWGRDIKRFHVPPGRFDGVIGGPPCQAFSPLVHMVRHAHGEAAIAENLIPEFERVVAEAQPAWFVMENSPFAPLPAVPGYVVTSLILNNRWIGEGVGNVQNRERRFSFGTRDGGALDVGADLAVLESPEVEPVVTTDARRQPVRIGGSGKVKRTLDVSPDLALFEAADFERAVIASGAKEGAVVRLDRGGQDRPARKRLALPGNLPRRSVQRCAELQGFEPAFLGKAPFTQEGKYRLIGNAVPVMMARVIARAVSRATGYALEGAA